MENLHFLKAGFTGWPLAGGHRSPAGKPTERFQNKGLSKRKRTKHGQSMATPKLSNLVFCLFSHWVIELFGYLVIELLGYLVIELFGYLVIKLFVY